MNINKLREETITWLRDKKGVYNFYETEVDLHEVLHDVSIRLYANQRSETDPDLF